MTQLYRIPNDEAVLDAFGEKGWDLRVYRVVEGGRALLADLPSDRIFCGLTYAICPQVEDQRNVLSVVQTNGTLRRTGRGSRLYLREGEFRTEGILMKQIGAAFHSTVDGEQPIVALYSNLERRVRNNFGPDLNVENN